MFSDKVIYIIGAALIFALLLTVDYLLGWYDEMRVKRDEKRKKTEK